MGPRAAIPIVLLLAVVILVTVFVLLRHDPGDEAADGVAGNATSTMTSPGVVAVDGVAYGPWHGRSARPTYGGNLRSCSLCHWNADLDFWRAEWTASAAEDGKVTSWNLTVAPRYAEVALLGIELDPGPAQIEERSNPAWNVGAEWAETIDVPQGATGLLVQVRAASSVPDADQAVQDSGNTTGQNANTNGPDPQRTKAELSFLLAGSGRSAASTGPEPDRQIVAIETGPGQWTVTATLDSLTYQGQALQQGTGLMRIEILSGLSAPAVAHEVFRADGRLASTPSATWTLPAKSNGDPPDVALRARAYQDHDDFYQLEINDAALMETRLIATPGPEALPTYSKAQIDDLWGQETEYELHRSAFSIQGLYTTDGEGRIQDYVTGEPYSERLPSDSGLLPGATSIRIEATWTPAIPLDGLEARFKPHNVPHWFIAEAVSSGAGSAVFEAEVLPAWWDASASAGGWDMNVLEALAPNRQYSYAAQVSLTLYAVR
jgi:hypothetical protein